MKVIITADWHFGYPNKLDDISWAFNTLINYAVSNDITKVFLLGDLIDDRKLMTHDVSNRLVDLLELARSHDIEVVAFPGNHDMFLRYSWKINGIRPFAEYMTFVDDISSFSLDGRKFWVVPFIEHEGVYQKVVEAVSKQANENDVLLTHIGVNSATLNVCFLLQNWSVVSFENTIFSKVFTGHFHCYQKVGTKTWYPGSPLAFRFDEGVVDHGFIVYDTTSNDHEFIKMYDIGDVADAPPDFVTLDAVNVTAELVSGNNVKIMLNDGDNENEIEKRILELGALKVTFTKPKEKIIDFTSINVNSDDVFESWLGFDEPVDYDLELLRNIHKEVVIDTPMDDSDDL